MTYAELRMLKRKYAYECKVLARMLRALPEKTSLGDEDKIDRQRRVLAEIEKRLRASAEAV